MPQRTISTVCNPTNHSEDFSPANESPVQSYHTGAGLNDVALTSDESGGSQAIINGTHLQFELNGQTFPSGLVLAYNQYYTRWWAPRLSPLCFPADNGQVGY